MPERKPYQRALDLAQVLKLTWDAVPLGHKGDCDPKFVPLVTFALRNGKEVAQLLETLSAEVELRIAANLQAQDEIRALKRSVRRLRQKNREAKS